MCGPSPEERDGWFGHGFCRYGHDILLRGRCRYGHGGQLVGTDLHSAPCDCPGSSHDGNHSASDILLNWQVRVPIRRP